MKEIVLHASAKINLALDITGLREDGYHLMDMIMQSVSLADTVRIRKTDDDISVTVRQNEVILTNIPQGKSNIAFKAAFAFFEKASIKSGCQIFIEKRIPSEAGMGGGSADAAAVLKGLNLLFDLPLSEQEISEIGLRIGADVPFCLAGGTARVQGIGEIIHPLPDWTDSFIVLIKPPFGISTAEAFHTFDLKGAVCRPDIPALEKALLGSDSDGMKNSMANVMEESAGYPEIGVLRQKLCGCGAYASLMTGSGSAVFGLFQDEGTAVEAMNTLLDEGELFIMRPVREGVRVIEKI